MGLPLQLITNSPTDNTITKSGLFAEMVRSTGDNAANIFRIAQDKYYNGVNRLTQT